MNKEDAEYHMNRCVKSGLWVPDKEKTAAAAAASGGAESQTEATTSQSDQAKNENNYEEVKN